MRSRAKKYIIFSEKKRLTTARKYAIIKAQKRKEKRYKKMTTSTHRINVRSIRKLTNNDGMTLKNGKTVTYKSGWQVAEEGCIVKTAEQAMTIARSVYGGNCGIWYSDGLYYIDPSRRVNTKREAMAIGKAHKQISVLCWRTMGLAYCEQ